MTSPPPAGATRTTSLMAPVAVLAGALCLSVTAILVKVAGVDAPTTATLRCVLALPVLLPLALGERRRRGALSRPGIGWAIIAGIALGLDYAAWTAAIYQVGAGISTVLINAQVIVLPLLALIVDREPVATRFLWALPLMVLGMSFVGGLWDRATLGPQALSGTGLGLLAGIAYGVYLFVTRHASRDEPGRAIQPLTWATASAAATTAILAHWTGNLHLSGISARSWTLLAILAVIGQVIAWLLIQHGGIRIAPTTTSGLLLLQPVLALGLSAALISERPTPLQLVGSAIVIAAVAMSHGLFHTLRRPATADNVLGISRQPKS